MATRKKTTPATTKTAVTKEQPVEQHAELILIPLQKITQIVLKDDAGNEYYMRHDLRGKFTLMPLKV